MRQLLCSVWALLLVSHVVAQAPNYKVIKTYAIASPGGWDYIAVHDGKLYVSHSTQVNILDEQTGDSVGYIPNTTGVHGIAFDPAMNRGYTSNGRLNTATVFSPSDNHVIAQIPTGKNPDFILYEPFSNTIITCNGSSSDLSVIDPNSNKVKTTIPVGGKPEAAVANDHGLLYVNIEDKSEIAVVNTKTFKVEHHWSIAPGEAPTGLAFNPHTQRLFAGCDNKLLMVINAVNGQIVDKLPIGDGCDGVAFDNKKHIIYTSNGEGTLTAIQEKDADHFSVIGNFTTARGARTLTLNEQTGTLYLPTADFETATAANGRPKMKNGTFKVLVVQ